MDYLFRVNDNLESGYLMPVGRGRYGNRGTPITVNPQNFVKGKDYAETISLNSSLYNFLTADVIRDENSGEIILCIN